MIQISQDASIDFQYQPPSPSFKMSMKTAAKLQFGSENMKRTDTTINSNDYDCALKQNF